MVVRRKYLFWKFFRSGEKYLILFFNDIKEFWRGLRKVFIVGFLLLNYSVVKIMFFFFILILKGSLLMIRKIGYIEILLFLKIGVLFVFNTNDRLFGEFSGLLLLKRFL